MGGNAFTGLSCPRLSPEQYYVIRDRSLAILKDKFYAKVICPPEAPSKEDHGDIDLLASEPTHTFTVGELSSALGAIRNTREGKTTSFAVPLSETPNTSNSNKGLPTTSTTSETQTISTTSKPDFTSTTTTKSYVQIDVHVCVPGYLEWELFHSSYGDLMQILGVMNRAIGLTANDRGLHIRISEIEPYNRKQSLIYLSEDPRTVMDFLSLNSSTYYSEEGGRGFESNEEIFEWCAKGKLYTLPSLSRASEGGNETANDRQRYKKRPMFTTCMTEYYPAHPELFADRKQWTRDEVLQEALRYFPHAKPLYDEAMEEHARVTWEKEVLGAIKGVIPVNGERLNEVMRGLKRFVRYEGGKPRLCDDHKEEITERPRWMQDVDSQVKLQELLAWVGVNWSAIRTLECKRMVAAKAARGAGKEKSAGAVSTSET